MSRAYALQTAHLSLAVAVKPSDARRKSPANTLSKNTRTCELKYLIKKVVPSHRHTWEHTLDLAHQLHRTCSSPTAFKVEPHNAAAPVCTSGGAAAQSPPPAAHHPQPHYKPHLTVSVIIPHVLMQHTSSQAK